MIARAGSGWQTVLADLSLILFMVTASAVRDAPPAKAAQNPPQSASLPALAQPVAVWTAAPGAPVLAQWLAAAGGDPRLRLTILAPPGAAAQALALAAAAGRPARIVLDPDRSGPVQALLGYDQSGLAQTLQSTAQSKPAQEPMP
jgi:hypothetical protein